MSEDVEAMMTLARTARREGNRAAALRHVQAVLAAAPGRRDARTDMAYDLLETGRVDEAAALFDELAAEAPDNAEIVIGQGRVARRRGDQAAALTLFLAGLALAPRHLGARLDVAYALADSGRAEEAEPAFRAILADHPGQMGALLGMARIARRTGDRAASLGWVETALAADPTHTGARLEAANDLLELGRPAEAATAFGEILARAPRHIDALLGLGRIARKAGRRAEALARFEAAIAAAPEHIGARLDLAYERLEAGPLDAAEALFRAVLAQSPRQASAMIGLGRIARRRGDRAAARAHFTAAIDADQRHVGARLELAADLREWGAFAEARRLLDEAVALSPNSLEVLLHQGALERQAGDNATALAIFEAAALGHPAAPQPLVEAAVQARALGRPEDAAKFLARALQTAPDHPEALAQQADLAWMAEEYQTCLHVCERARALYPDRLWTYTLAARVLAAEGRWLDGLALLDRAAELLGPRPEITAGRIEVLKPRGAWPQLRAVLAGATDEVATNFRLFVEQMQAHIAFGEFAAAEALLAAPPVASDRDLARVAMLRGYIDEAQWRIAEAAGHYTEALRLSPQDPGMHNEMARACLLLLDLEGAARHNAISVQLNASAAKLRRQSLQPAQSHLGQVLDEFRMDGAAIERLAELAPLPPAERIGKLRALARDDPGHTPTAIFLVLALRQAGLLTPRPVQAGHPTMPRRMLQFWDQPEPPPDVAALMATWRENNPAWTYHRFDTQTAWQFIRASYGPEVANAFRRARHPAQKADVFRLAWLFVHGGLYLDADDRCLSPLESLLPPGTAFVSYQESYSTTANNVLGATPGHPVIGRALDDAVTALNRGDGDSLWLSTGPGLITRSFAQEFARAHVLPELWLQGVFVAERYELPRAVAIHTFARYKTSKLHWNRHEFGNGAVVKALTA